MMHEVENSLDQFKVGNSYETVEFIGYNGSTGVIYKGRNISLDTPVAIKILNPELSINDQFMQFLNTELKSVFKLNHPNIVNVKETGKTNDKFYIIMEFVEGENLEKILKEKNKLPVKEAVELLKQLALAIDYANSNDVIHKAIKPRNIMVTKDNHLKLTGFGLSKALSTAWLTITATSSVNLEYLSPEQAEGEEVDHRCDIYSLGIIAYQLLTGEVPFKKEGNSIINLAMQHINLSPDPPGHKNPAIPRGLENIVLKCLEKKPANRFQSGKEIFDALNKDFYNEPIVDISINKNDYIHQTQSITKDELSNSLLNIYKGENAEVPDGYYESKEVPFQKDNAAIQKATSESVNPFAKIEGSESFNIKNQKQLKLLLLIVILLELIIISIFVYILFLG